MSEECAMIHNESDYLNAVAINEEEWLRIDGLVEIWKKQGLTDDEVKRLSDPMMSLHLQFVEEAEAWRLEHDGFGIGIEESANGFAVRETQSGGTVLYYGSSATASRMDMLLSDELFPTQGAAEEHMFAEFHDTGGGCMGPPPPTRAEISAATNSVLAALRRMDLLKTSEESLHQPMAESRRRVMWLLEKAVEEILTQNACETF